MMEIFSTLLWLYISVITLPSLLGQFAVNYMHVGWWLWRKWHSWNRCRDMPGLAFHFMRTCPSSREYHVTMSPRCMYMCIYIYIYIYIFHGERALVGQDIPTIKASRSPSDALKSVGFLWTSDQPDAETSTWQHTTFTTERYPCPRRDSNLQSQQESGDKTTPQTARPVGLAEMDI